MRLGDGKTFSEGQSEISCFDDSVGFEMPVEAVTCGGALNLCLGFSGDNTVIFGKGGE